MHKELCARGIEIVVQSRATTAENVTGVDCIVAAGGDGTIVRVIGPAMKLGVPVGIVPVGTFNELARTLEVPLEVAAACDVVAGGHTRTIDVGSVNGVYYINEASIGISSRAAYMQTSELKQRFGFLAIAVTSIQALWYARTMTAEVSYDENVERFKTVQLTIANSHRFGGFFAVSDAAVDDGWLDLYSVEIDSFWKAFEVARAVFSGKRESVPGLRTLRSTAFTVRTRHRHRISADGEPAGTTPATYRVLPKALRVLVPE